MLVKDLVDATLISEPAFKYTPQSTSRAINESTLFIIPIVKHFFCLQIFKQLYTSIVSPDWERKIHKVLGLVLLFGKVFSLNSQALTILTFTK